MTKKNKTKQPSGNKQKKQNKIQENATNKRHKQLKMLQKRGKCKTKGNTMHNLCKTKANKTT